MLRAAVAGVPADGWQRPTPCTEWNVAQVLQHAALDQGRGRRSSQGRSRPARTRSPRPVSWARQLALRRGGAGRVRAGLGRGQRGRRAGAGPPLPSGPHAAADAAGAAALDAAIHAWDMAVATGQGRRSPRTWPGR